MLQLRLFGPPRVRRDETDVRFDTRKAPALLAVLAVTGRGHGREALAGMLWPDLDHVRARAALRRTLSVAAAVGPALVVTPAEISLEPEAIWCDVLEFRSLARSTDAADWARAAELAASPFLEGFSLRDSPVFDDWQIATGDALRDLASHTLGRLVAASVESGDLAAAVAYARRRTQIEPLSEPAHADLIRVTAWSGDRAGALTAYRSLVRLLDRELGVAPLPETLELQAAIRAGTLPPPAAAAPARPPGRVEPPAPARRLVGRGELLERLALVWESGASRVVGITGEPGIGKTAVLDAFATRHAGEGARVVRLAGHESERGLAYAAANDLVRAMLAADADLPSRLGAAGGPLAALSSEIDGPGPRGIRDAGELHRVHDAVRAALAEFAREVRVAVIADDADAIDPPSAALVAYVLRRLPPGVAMLAAWAAGADGTPLPAAVSESGEVVVLPPLGIEEVAELLRGTPHDADEALLRTRGLPLLVSEYAASDGTGADGTPIEVHDVVAGRFAAVAATTRQVVAAAALVGTVADPELLRVASGRDEGETVEAIEEAVARGLLVERADRTGYDVPHDVVRDVALAWMSLARVRLIHGRVADLLARRHAVDPLATPAGAVAQHLAAAGRDDEATAWFLDAAAAAARLSAHAEALEQLVAARSLGRRPLDVHEGIGLALTRLGRYRDALVSLDRASALAEGDARRQAAIEHAIAGVYDRLGDPRLTQSHLEAARDLVGATPSGLGARVLADLALVRHRLGSPESAVAAALDAERTAAEAADEAALAQAENVLGIIAAARGELGAARERLDAAAARAATVGDADLRVAALNNLSRVHQSAGEPDAALAAAREALAGAERRGDRHRIGALHSHVADLLHELGREEEAVAAMKDSAAAFSDLQDAHSQPRLWTMAEW